MKTYKLHEIIEMARAGKKFEASNQENYGGNDYFLFKKLFNPEDVIADWTVKFEPEVVECVMIAPPCGDLFASNGENIGKKLQGKRWKACFTEIVEGE